MRALTRCVTESSICSINYNSTRTIPPLPPVSFQWPQYTWVKSRKPHSALWLMQSHTTCIPLPLLELHSLKTTPQLPILPHTHAHTHTDRYTPAQIIPCWYLDVLSIKNWKWEREQIKALSQKMSCPRGLFLLCCWIDVVNQSLYWWRDCWGPRGQKRPLFVAWLVDCHMRAVLGLYYGHYILQLSECQDYICSVGIVFMLVSWKQGEIASEIKAQPISKHRMWVDCYLSNLGWEQDSVHKETATLMQRVSKRMIGKEDLWFKKQEKSKRSVLGVPRKTKLQRHGFIGIEVRDWWEDAKAGQASYNWRSLASSTDRRRISL